MGAILDVTWTRLLNSSWLINLLLKGLVGVIGNKSNAAGIHDIVDDRVFALKHLETGLGVYAAKDRERTVTMRK